MLSYKGKEKLFSNTKEFIDKKSHVTGVAWGPSRIQMTGGANQNYQPRSDNRPPAPHKQVEFPGFHDKLSASHELVDFPRTDENPSASWKQFPRDQGLLGTKVELGKCFEKVLN